MRHALTRFVTINHQRRKQVFEKAMPLTADKQLSKPPTMPPARLYLHAAVVLDKDTLSMDLRLNIYP
jgi:hypothetical protein